MGIFLSRYLSLSGAFGIADIISTIFCQLNFIFRRNFDDLVKSRHSGEPRIRSGADSGVQDSYKPFKNTGFRPSPEITKNMIPWIFARSSKLIKQYDFTKEYLILINPKLCRKCLHFFTIDFCNKINNKRKTA